MLVEILKTLESRGATEAALARDNDGVLAVMWQDTAAETARQSHWLRDFITAKPRHRALGGRDVAQIKQHCETIIEWCDDFLDEAEHPGFCVHGIHAGFDRLAAVISGGNRP